jgi:hypothetical protein
MLLFCSYRCYCSVTDPIVRSELMEQVPHLAVYCQDNLDLYEKSISSYLLPMVVRYLNDQNNQVNQLPHVYNNATPDYCQKILKNGFPSTLKPPFKIHLWPHSFVRSLHYFLGMDSLNEQRNCSLFCAFQLFSPYYPQPLWNLLQWTQSLLKCLIKKNIERCWDSNTHLQNNQV